PMSSAKPALLHATPGRLRYTVSVEHFVDHHSARLNLFCYAAATRNVFSPHACRQSEYAIVRQSYSLVFRLESHDGKHRPKSLVTHHQHSVIYVRQHGRLVKRA